MTELEINSLDYNLRVIKTLDRYSVYIHSGDKLVHYYGSIGECSYITLYLDEGLYEKFVGKRMILLGESVPKVNLNYEEELEIILELNDMFVGNRYLKPFINLFSRLIDDYIFEIGYDNK